MVLVIVASSSWVWAGLHRDGNNFQATIEGVPSGPVTKLRILQSRDIKVTLQNNHVLNASDIYIATYTFQILSKKAGTNESVVIYTETPNGHAITTTILQHCNDLRPGDKVTITNAIVKLPEGKTEAAHDATYTIASN